MAGNDETRWLEDGESNGLDAEFTDLFAAFDDVRASDDLVASTLSRVSEFGEENDRRQENAKDIPEKAVPEHAASVSADAGKSGGKAAVRKARFRAMRVAALAACLVLALTGGVAYAVPSSYVAVNQGDGGVELGVNVFGITVSARALDEAGERVVEAVDLLHKGYSESLDGAVAAMEGERPDEPVDVHVESGPQGQRERLEEAGREVMERHGAASPQSEPSGSGQPQGAAPGAGQPQGVAPDEGQPQEGQPSGAQPNGGDQPAGGPSQPANPDGNSPAGAAMGGGQPEGDESEAALPAGDTPQEAPLGDGSFQDGNVTAPVAGGLEQSIADPASSFGGNPQQQGGFPGGPVEETRF